MSGTAWNNGNYYCPKPETYIDMDHYGTHDWIAEYALGILNLRLPNVFSMKLASDQDNLRRFFLGGTDAPDMRKSGKTFLITTRCGGIISQTDFMTYDHTTYQNTLLQKHAQHVTNKYLNALDKKDSQMAAYFLGAVMHYVSDATLYNHLSQNFPHSTNYVNKIQLLTKTPWATRNADAFFSYTEAFSLFMALPFAEDADIAVEWASTEVWEGGGTLNPIYSKGFFFTASEMNTHTPLNHFNALLPSEFRYWKQMHWSRLEGDALLYFKTIEHHLNTAIFYCASVLNMLTPMYIGDDCQSQEDEDQGENRLDPLGEKLELIQEQANDPQKKMDEFMGYFALSIVGSIISFYMLGLTLKKFLGAPQFDWEMLFSF